MSVVKFCSVRMATKNQKWCYFFTVLILSVSVHGRSLQPEGDVDAENYEEPSFWKRQLSRVSSAAGSVGSTFGKTATRLTAWMDRICHVVKKIIPIVGAICTVGQFKFCVLDSVPEGFEQGAAIVGGRKRRENVSQTEEPDQSNQTETTGYQPINLDEPDK